MASESADVAREYIGRRFRVVHCDGALDSYWEALRSVDARRAKSFTRNIIAQIKRLADGQPMSKGSFPKEGTMFIRTMTALPTAIARKWVITGAG